jgi:hypothetical protein
LAAAPSRAAYLERLKEDGQLVAYRITRCKLGLAPPNLREWHITLDFLCLSQLDQAFTAVSERTDPIESFHQAVNFSVRKSTSDCPKVTFRLVTRDAKFAPDSPGGRWIRTSST